MRTSRGTDRARYQRRQKRTAKEAKKATKEATIAVSARTRGRGSCRRPKTCGRKRKNAASRVDASEPTTKVSQTSEAQIAEVEHMSTRRSCCINSICFWGGSIFVRPSAGIWFVDLNCWWDSLARVCGFPWPEELIWRRARAPSHERSQM